MANLEFASRKKTFCVKVDNKAYGFDYYIIFDNLYRAIQRAIRSKRGRKYEDGWGNIQQDTSETFVKKIISKVIARL